MSRKKADDSPEPPGPRADPLRAAWEPALRRWFLTLAAVTLAPWLLAGFLVLRGTIGPESAPEPALPDSAGRNEIALGEPGPWGRIETAPIVISPPLELIPDDPVPPPSRVDWFFPAMSPEEVGRFLAEAGVGRHDVARLLSGARLEPRVQGTVVSPDREVVLRLAPETRSRIYLLLSASPLNERQRNAPRFFGGSADEWLGAARLQPRTLAFVRPLVYGHEGFLYFADVDLARSEIPDPQEQRRLAKALLRESTLVVRLRLGPDTDVDAAAEYWGRGGRMTDVRPLIESVASLGPGYSIDVAHLLPPFARLHLYRYPQVSLADFDGPELANCYWTALNFFSRQPDDAFLDLRRALGALRRDYYLVHDRFQLGDVVVFSDPEGNAYHVAVHVADGLLFGKNGASPLAPWTILPLERLRGYYPLESAGRVQFYRRKDL